MIEPLEHLCIGADDSEPSSGNKIRDRMKLFALIYLNSTNLAREFSLLFAWCHKITEITVHSKIARVII